MKIKVQSLTWDEDAGQWKAANSWWSDCIPALDGGFVVLFGTGTRATFDSDGRQLTTARAHRMRVFPESLLDDDGKRVSEYAAAVRNVVERRDTVTNDVPTADPEAAQRAREEMKQKREEWLARKRTPTGNVTT